MNDDDYYKTVIQISNEFLERQKYKRIIDYLKKNHLAIIAIIVSIIALFK